MSGEEYEWNELESADNLRTAIELNPQERAHRRETYTDATVTRLISRRATPEEAKKCSANIQTVFHWYPWVIDCEDNARNLITLRNCVYDGTFNLREVCCIDSTSVKALAYCT